jgi:hypothetical protein
MRNAILIMTMAISALAFWGCSKDGAPVLGDPAVVYRYDMMVKIDGKLHEGTAVVPVKGSYQVHVQAAGPLSAFFLRTCAGEEVTPKAWNVEGSERWLIFKRKIEKKREVIFEHRPTAREVESYCPLQLVGLDEEGGQDSRAMIDFQTPQELLAATVNCNRSEYESTGVTLCQSKEGSITKISFQEKVTLKPSSCPIDAPTEGNEFEFSMPLGECVFTFEGLGGKHRLTTLGYNQVMMRNPEKKDD